jgi:hypothetical protein
MKKREILFAVLIALVLISVTVAPVMAKKDNSINTITEGEVFYRAGHYLEGEPIPTGYDPFGYNYQGHMFKGSYFNVYSGGDGYAPYDGDDEAYLLANPGAENHWAWPYRDVKLIMKWNDAWISNKDCDGDGLLDRHYGYSSYVGSGAWETNHQWGTYEQDGETYSWNYFCKIVAAPADAYADSGYWYTADGVEIGPVIWGEFAIIQEVYNDQGTGEHGVCYNAPAPTGFGYYMP